MLSLLKIKMENNSNIEYSTSEGDVLSNILKPPYQALIYLPGKCYTFDTTYIQGARFQYYSITLDKSFPYLNITYIGIHHPNQLNQLSLKWFNLNDLDLSNHLTKQIIFVQIQGITTLKRRNKKESSCTEDWKHADRLLFNEISAAINCRHPYINTSNHFEPCTQKTQLDRFAQVGKTYFIPPCVSIIDTTLDVSLHSATAKDDKTLKIIVMFAIKEFKEISMVIKIHCT